MKTKLCFIIILVLGMLQSSQTYAQIDMEEKSKNAVENRADQRTDEGID